VRAWVDVCFLMDTEGPCDDPDKPELNATWEQVDACMDKLFASEFRERYPDPRGGLLRIGWFFLTWTGFRTNPRNRPFGYHRVRDHWLERWADPMARYGDEQCWHYHHPPESGIGNEWGLDWTRDREFEQIVSRQILERGWFPSCFRAGGTILDGLSSRWVDAWFPFDYSNRAPLAVDGLIDWTGGIDRWTVYHPDPEDFRRPGPGRRRMGRSLDRRSWVHVLSQEDVDAAFAQAAAGEPAILSCFDHDSRDIAEGVDGFRAMIADAAERHPGVPWRYAGPVEAMRNFLDVPMPPRLELDASVLDGDVFVQTSGPIFQSIPWLVLRRGDEIEPVVEGILRVDETSWRWTPGDSRAWDELGIAASTDLGESAVVVVRPDDTPGRLRLRSPLAESPTQPNSIWAYSTLFPELAIGRASGNLDEMDSARQATELLRKRLDPGGSVLDVGSAAGHLWRSLEPLGFEYHGIDPEEHVVEIGRRYLASEGLPQSRLRAIPLERLPRTERYDAVVSLSTLLYFPAFQEPLELMARAADRILVIRSLFGDRTEIRWLPDILLETGFQEMRAYFNVYARDEVEGFLRSEGFSVEWVEDRRRAEKFGGAAEIVGGLELPYEFLVAQRVAGRPSVDDILGERFGELARAWREERAGGPPG
jgi:Methyltransferase domain